jgi:hypothetical protein
MSAVTNAAQPGTPQQAAVAAALRFAEQGREVKGLPKNNP